MSKTCITSDQHFWHKNILKFQLKAGSRPFDTVQEMNEGIIERHNEVVDPDDEVWMIGDFGFCNVNQAVSILERLNGRKHFVFGNHDRPMRDPRVRRFFESMSAYNEIKIGKTRCVLSHFPFLSWNREHHGALHFYGHTHNSIPYVEQGYSMDIGCDANMCYPFIVEDIIDSLATYRLDNDLPDGRNPRKREGDAR